VISADLIVCVNRWCQALSRHMPTNCGPQKLLLAIASHWPVEAADNVFVDEY